MKELSENVSPSLREFRDMLAPVLNHLCNRMEVKHMVDFYCDYDPIMTRLKVGHPMQIQCYDPKVERFKTAPMVTELVFFAIESEDMNDEEVDLLLSDIEDAAGMAIFLAIKHSHRHREWWVRKIMERFDLQTYQALDEGFYMLAYPNRERILMQ